GTLADRGGEGLGTLLHRLVEQDRALRDRILQALDAGGERALQRLGPLLHGLVEGSGPLHHDALERRELLGRAVDDLGEAPLMLAQAIEQSGNGVRDTGLSLVNLVGRLARTGDEELSELSAALGEPLVDGARCSGDVAGDLSAHALQRVADTRAV